MRQRLVVCWDCGLRHTVAADRQGKLPPFHQACQMREVGEARSGEREHGGGSHHGIKSRKHSVGSARPPSPDPSPEVLRGWISCCGRLEGKAGARCDFGEDRKRRFRPCTDSFLSRSGRQPGVQGTLKHRPGGNPSEAEGEEACGRYAGAACSGCSTAAARLRTTRMKSLCHG